VRFDKIALSYSTHLVGFDGPMSRGNERPLGLCCAFHRIGVGVIPENKNGPIPSERILCNRTIRRHFSLLWNIRPRTEGDNAGIPIVVDGNIFAARFPSLKNENPQL